MNFISEKLRDAAKRCEGVFDPGFFNPWLEAAKEIDRLSEKVVMIHEIVAPPPPGSHDITDRLKVLHYDELRRRLYPDNPS